MTFASALPDNSVLEWEFPLPRPHCGVPLGNGTLGVLVWGEDVLCLTIARAGFWDRRGGAPFSVSATFDRVRERLEAGDEAGLLALFAPDEERAPDTPPCPIQIGGARLEMRFDGDFSPRGAILHLQRGQLEVELQSRGGQSKTIVIWVHPDAELCVVEGAEDAQLTLRPAWEWLASQLEPWGFEPPHAIQIEHGGGFIQDVPSDEALALVWRRRDERILIAAALDGDLEEAGKRAVQRARQLPDTRPEFFWNAYWRDVPLVELPDEQLNRKWLLGLWKQAGLTPPQGVAATLQGPWMEEYQLPPWSNDYHFNINVQLVYYPALMTNRTEHFAPLWKMIRDWMPTLQRNGAVFFGREGALMLPHAVDDECHVVGTFWSGTIDHACTAWVAQMAWLHYRYSLNETVLREVAWPLLRGSFEGYWAMHEERGGRFSLPVSVSPEYRASQMNAWGRDASFQLAAWHMTAQLLEQAALVLGEPVDPRWREVEDRLPFWSSLPVPGNSRDTRPTRMALWEGLELEESHRHHSHLAAIWPFCSVDPFEHAETVAHSFAYWNKMGAGQWTGWCLPWASILCSRFELPDAAVAWLGWLDHFSNVGDGTRHNADFSGVGALDNGQMWSRQDPRDEREVMQMDASMGFLIAVCELLVQCRRDAIHVLPSLPRRWKRLAFDGIRTEGAFLVGASVEGGRTVEVRVFSERGGKLKLAHGLGEEFLLDGRESPGKVLEREMKAGDRLVLRRVEAV